jgi:hypothetical protein
MVYILVEPYGSPDKRSANKYDLDLKVE